MSGAALREQSLTLLRQALDNPAADFRDGQWEAIEDLVERRARLLVVQRTGWGKSLVYFLGTRLLREHGAGPTLLVSPLLALMRNQVDAATRLGVRAETLNSTNPDEWKAIEDRLRWDDVDVLVISPERLANETFVLQAFLPIAAHVGLFVVDEAHCISDWGHDFRPDYRRIARILERLPPGVPVCATTATANDRVVADVVSQLGADLRVCRGPLVRDSLRLQTVPLADDAAKLAWLAHHLPRFPGSGIVYALTVRWTERIAAWLQRHGVTAVAYSADLSDEDRRAREEQLRTNKVKALVATTALGMGYDKPDLGFVVHFHQPGSVVHYYQQVGRAGRAVAKAYGVMLAGGDDRAINDYFIEQAFPSEEDVVAILEALEKSERGLTTAQLESAVNLSRMRIDAVLKTLAVETPAPLARLENRWVTTPNRYDPGRRHQLVQQRTALRRREQEHMDCYREHTGCLMEFLARALDDPAAGPCGRCAPCQGKLNALRDVPENVVAEAVAFLCGAELAIEPKAQWPAGALPHHDWQGRIPAEWRAQPGRSLGLWGDGGWGARVRDAREHRNRYPDELVEALAGLVRCWKPHPAPCWVTCVPSVDHPRLVPDLADRLAHRLYLPFVPVVHAAQPHRPQAELDNAWQRARNLDGAFRVAPFPGMARPVLLVDDVTLSGWTLTVVSALLLQAGSGPVFPVTLASRR